MQDLMQVKMRQVWQRHDRANSRRTIMSHSSLRVIREEHAALSAMLRSLSMMVREGEPSAQERENHFAVLRSMLFYIDEFPEKLHHTKESRFLFPPVSLARPDLAEVIARLDHDHAHGESSVRELMHLLIAWECMGESRRAAFEEAVHRYVRFYLEHMQVEETQILPAAYEALSEAEWKAMDEGFAQHLDPFVSPNLADGPYRALFDRITQNAPAPIGLRQNS
jgi:hemerythrin-like domain-containing protein